MKNIKNSRANRPNGNSALQKLPAKKYSELIRIGLILVCAFTLAFLLTFQINILPQEVNLNSRATKDIYADQNYKITDEKESKRLQQIEIEKVKDVFDYNPSIGRETARKISQAFSNSRLFLAENSLFEPQVALSSEQEQSLKELFSSYWNGSISPEAYQTLRRLNFDQSIEDFLTTKINQKMGTQILSDRESILPLMEKGIVLRTLTQEKPFPERVIRSTQEFSALVEIREQINNLKLKETKLNDVPIKIKKDDFEILKTVLLSQLKANVNFNSLETDARREKATESSQKIVKVIEIERGEPIILKGDEYKPIHQVIFQTIKQSRDNKYRFLKFLGVFLFLNLSLLIIYYHATKISRKFHLTTKDFVFLSLTLVTCVILMRVGVFIGSTVRDALPFSVGFSTIYYAIPLAGGAMIVRLILNAPSAIVFGVTSSLFAGLFLENSLEMALYFLISSTFAAQVVARSTKRSSVLLSGVFVGLVNAMATLALNLIAAVSISSTLSASDLALNCAFGFFGGIFAAMTVLVIMPLMEILFNYASDITLLELANVSHPLLKQMIVKAPGTYHHSQMVGVLAEAGAQEIGANALLARVASYYHDIGKMKKAQYFIENQKGENPHDKLTPTMSALIIEAHVKDGIEMAQKHKLPQNIADMIPQHQGTKLIGYFYNKAKELNPEEADRIDEKDFRYPGPKPQTREAGLIMLADTIEAAVRAMPDKTPNKIEALVNKMINLHFVDEQLDECDLTLRDLHLIAGAYTKVLIGVYHQRIEYPDSAKQIKGLTTRDPRKKKNNENSSEQPAPEQENPKTIPITKNLKKSQAS